MRRGGSTHTNIVYNRIKNDVCRLREGEVGTSNEDRGDNEEEDDNGGDDGNKNGAAQQQRHLKNTTSGLLDDLGAGVDHRGKSTDNNQHYDGNECEDVGNNVPGLRSLTQASNVGIDLKNKEKGRGHTSPLMVTFTSVTL